MIVTCAARGAGGRKRHNEILYIQTSNRIELVVRNNNELVIRVELVISNRIGYNNSNRTSK